MSKILYNEELEQFIKDNKLDCNSIIIKIEDDKAYYIIDGQKKVEGNYDILKRFF